MLKADFLNHTLLFLQHIRLNHGRLPFLVYKTSDFMIHPKSNFCMVELLQTASRAAAEL